MYTYTYIHIYIYESLSLSLFICIYIYIYIHREREREILAPCLRNVDSEFWENADHEIFLCADGARRRVPPSPSLFT